MAAVGEIGLDHHWPLPAQEQYDLFEAQLRLAAELDLPVSVHDREAHAETYELLKKYKPRGVLHCYSGSAEDAAWLVDQGMCLGFGGAVTYKGAKRAAKVLAAIPHEAAVLETDCPYMSPHPGARQAQRQPQHHLCGRVHRHTVGDARPAGADPDRRQRPPGVWGVKALTTNHDMMCSLC